MHHLLLAAAFLAIILAPCLMPLNTGNEGFEDEEETC